MLTLPTHLTLEQLLESENKIQTTVVKPSLKSSV